MAIQMKFGGFYQSNFDDILSYEADDIISNYDKEFPNIEINWKDTFLSASKNMVGAFNQVMSDYGYDINLEFDSLYSPREYNFETDYIILKEYDNEKLYEQLINFLNEYNLYDDYRELLKDYTTSTSGYIAFYRECELSIEQLLTVMIETIFLDEKFLRNIEECFELSSYDCIEYTK